MEPLEASTTQDQTSVLVPQIGWIDRGLLLMVSPLWFLALHVTLPGGRRSGRIKGADSR